jgi:hypothetical protein
MEEGKIDEASDEKKYYLAILFLLSVTQPGRENFGIRISDCGFSNPD